MTGSSFTCGTSHSWAGRSAAPRRTGIIAFQPVRNFAVLARHVHVVLAATLVDDKSVPEAHKGLHGFLYGDGGSEEHERGSSYCVRKGEDEGDIVMPVPAYLDSRDNEKPLGVYCVYNAQRVPQYIGFSRNMVLAVKGHLARMGPEDCALVRAIVYGNRVMASRANLERGVMNWVDELPELGGRLPPGNANPALRASWEGTAPPSSGGSDSDGAPLAAPAPLDRTLMSPAELAAYEEKKLKMRKAMGDKMVEVKGGAGTEAGHNHDDHDKPQEEDDLATRRLKLMKAMNRGDWSAVIDAQTKETVAASSGLSTSEDTATAAPKPISSTDGGGVEAAVASSSALQSMSASGTSTDRSGGGTGGIVSPFQEGGAAAAVRTGVAAPAPRALTVAAVQVALEEVRPYLMADGGDVEVVEVKDGIVYLRLQGACSSCPSQSATMKGGIERVIRQTFGDQVRDILQLDALDPVATVERVDNALNMLRGAISNLGGSAEVLSVEAGVCTIRYRGPPAIGKGVLGAIRDTFPNIREVRLVD